MNRTSASIGVIGAGSWGTALAILLCQNFSTVKLWGRQGAKALRADRCNRQYLPGVSFPDNLCVTSEFSGLMDSNLNFLVAVPSHGFRNALKSLYAAILHEGLDPGAATIIWGAKGFDTETGQLLSEVVADIFPSATLYGCVSGPSFAAETARGAANRADRRLSPGKKTPNAYLSGSEPLQPGYILAVT